MARRYKVAGRGFTKVSAHHLTENPIVHVVEDGQFWRGNKSWEHIALCGASIAGTPVSLQKVNCSACRAAIESLKPKT